MQINFSTGEAARQIRTSEPKLQDLIRRGKIQPAPTLCGGRRVWSADHIIQAAEHLGLLTDELRRELGLEVGNVQ